MPLILCNVGYGLFFDNTSDGSVTAGRTDNGTRLVFEFDGGPLDFYYFACESPRSALATAAHLLGTPLLPPRWSLGFLQSTRHFESDNELRRLSSEIRERNFPCDALIFLSTYSDALGWNRQVGLLDFEPSLWRDPPTLLEEMKERHFHVITHEYPVLHPTSPDFSEAERMGYLLSDGYPNLSPADRAPASYQQGQRYIDFSHSEARRWWWRRHRQLCELGISGWWLDGGEGPRRTTRMAAGEGRDLHNVYDLLRIRAFAEGESEDRQDLRPFMVCRSGGPGMHRYGAWCWSGDIDNTFEVLEQQVQLGLSAAMSGIVFWGTDIGGFFHAVPESAELYTRWFQFGAFCPLFRAHGRIWREHLPWAHGEQVEEICRRYAELRYQLLPYTYTLAWQAHSTGLPLMRPLCLNNPNDPRAWDECHEYLWGDDILVAPVTREGARHCAVYLPEGGWYDYWTQLRYEGGRGVEVEAPLERLPLFVREGGIIPMSQIKQYDDGRPVEEVTLLIYPVRSRGASAQFDLYEDDGASNGYRRGDFAVSRIECARGLDGTVRLSVSPPEGNALLLPRNRSYLAKVHMPRPRKVSVHDAGTSVEWSFENGFLFFRLAGSVMSVVILPS
ncbi:MAG TPA: TIM-barrel domain-containing protein [Spirochaetia bacterium]|nr:TIM-barrel domain-containing protein [Spirochaetia bacterium]